MTEAEVIKALYSMYCVAAYKGTITIDKETAIGIYEFVNRKNEETDYWKQKAFDGCMEKDRIFKEAKAETVKEFTEKVHRSCAIYGPKDKFNKTVFLNIVNQIAKELERR